MERVVPAGWVGQMSGRLVIWEPYAVQPRDGNDSSLVEQVGSRRWLRWRKAVQH